MLNCNLNSEIIRVSMAAKHCSASYEREKKAKITSERFVQIGKMLLDSRVIVFCLNCDLNGTLHIEVFTNDTETVAEEDCCWIFEKCADVKQNQNAYDALNKTVYSIKKVSNDNVSDSSDEDNFDFIFADFGDDNDKLSCREVFTELLKQNASIQIIAGAEEDNNTVEIALPDEMPLRMKAMIALALPGYEVIKSSEAESKSDNSTSLAYSFIEKCVESLLDVLMQNVQKQHEDNSEDSNTALVNCKLINKIKLLNMEFTGNPGTAKTTIARILAKILYEIGILNSKEIVEVGRADLVAGYVGQTAIKVKDVFEKAKGRLLFIDEAYSLADGQKGKFADEAINAIVQLMENNREDTVVIFAGYPNEMKDFFAANPGLRSRVPFRIEFPDYSADEMVQITKLEAQKRGFAVSAEAEEGVACICQKAVESTEKGNGRFCRNLVDSAILSFAERKYGDYCDTKYVINDFLLDNCDFEISKTLLISDGFLPIGFTA